MKHTVKAKFILLELRHIAKAKIDRISTLKAVGAKRISIATPYIDEINLREVAYLRDAGFETCALRGLNLVKDSDMIRVRPDVIARLAASVDRPDADAVFISCGALRSIDIIEDLGSRPINPLAGAGIC